MAVSRLRAERDRKVAVKVVDGDRGETGINDLKKGRIQFCGPVPDDRGLALAGAAGKDAEAFGPGKVVKAEQSFIKLCAGIKDLFGILEFHGRPL